MAKKVRLDVKATGANKASKDLGKVDKGLSKLAKSAAATAVGFFGVQGLINGFTRTIELTKQQVVAESQLNAVLKSTKGVAGLTAKELTNMASALQKQTRFGDEAIMTAQSLMLTFTKVGKDVFPDAIETVMNMSEAMGQDMKQSVIQVGKALNDPILGVTALRRVGVQLSEQQEQQVRDFVAVGDVASAQKVILGELETQFGGADITITGFDNGIVTGGTACSGTANTGGGGGGQGKTIGGTGGSGGSGIVVIRYKFQ